MGKRRCGWDHVRPPHPRATMKQVIRGHLMRDRGGRCEYCHRKVENRPRLDGTIGQGGDATIDHVIPRSEGGGWDYGNLRLACRNCNADKGWLSAEEYDLIRSIRTLYWPSRLRALCDEMEWGTVDTVCRSTSPAWTA